MDIVTLIIDGLPLSFTASDLTLLLGQWADVVHSRIATDPAGISLGFGYVEVASETGAEQLTASLTGKHIGGAHALMLGRVDAKSA